MISPRRAAYLRVFAAADVAYYRFEAAFPANEGGIAPVWEDRCSVLSQSATAVLSYPRSGAHSPPVLTGSREMMQKIAGVLSAESRLFIRAASVEEVFSTL